MTIHLARSERQIRDIRTLFREYQRELGVDLCFQGFEQELAGLPGTYAPPSGRLFLALAGAQAAGCISLQRRSETECEMKRLFVRPAFRKSGIGRELVERVLREARSIGYSRLVLDTLPSMAPAQRLYADLGFREIPPYRANPVPGAIYMGLDLTAV